MTTLARVVRPFQTNIVTPPQRVLTLYQVDAKNVMLVIGRNGGGKTFSGSFSSNSSRYMDTKLKETSPF